MVISFVVVVQVAASAAKAPGVSKVLLADSADLKGFMAERVTAVLESAQKQFNFTHIVGE